MGALPFGSGFAALDTYRSKSVVFAKIFRVASYKWVAAGPTNLQLSTCNLQLVSPRHAWFRLRWPRNRPALPVGRFMESQGRCIAAAESVRDGPQPVESLRAYRRINDRPRIMRCARKCLP